MKNKFFKAVLSAVVAVFAFSLSACEQLDFSEKLDLIASDVDYGYSLYNERYLVIDGTHYKFKTLASEVVEGDGSSEVYGTTVFGGNMYYLYQ